jgi:hypothetical protein
MCFPVIFLLFLPTRSVALSWHAGPVLPDTRGLPPITFDSQFFADRLALPAAYSRAILQLMNVIITGIGSPAGGAVSYLACDVRIANSSISECWAARGGALRLTSSWLSLCGVTFSGCEAMSDGGAIDCFAPPSVAISDTKFVRCAAQKFGGAVAFSHVRQILIESSAFESCLATSSGDCLALLESIAIIARSVFCEIGAGGAIFASATAPSILETANCSFFLNSDGGIITGVDVRSELLATQKSRKDRFLRDRRSAISGSADVMASRFAVSLDDFRPLGRRAAPHDDPDE